MSMQLVVPTLADRITGASYSLQVATIVAAVFVIAKLTKRSEDHRRILQPFAGIVAVVFVHQRRLTNRSKLDAIPTVGSTTWLGSWWAGMKFVTNATDVIQEGYDKYKGAPFKVSNVYRWMVVVSAGAVNDTLKAEYMFGHDVHHDRYHVSILRSQLTRNLGSLYPEINDEIVAAFEETLDLKGDEWKSVPALHTVQKVVCRTSNRIFVGLPLCRNPDWIALNIEFTWDVIKGAIIVGLCPKFMAPFVARFMTSVPGTTRRAAKHLGSIIEERKKCLEEYGPAWADKPNDLLSWLMDEAKGSQCSIESLTRRILNVNFAGILSSSNSFTQALFNLAANPQYIQPLREEVESIVETEGWSRDAVAKMHKIDSFLTESLRFEGITCVGMSRKAMKDATFSDGTVIPKGTIVTFAAAATYHDNEHYENADMFDPFRFANMRDEDGEGVKHQFVSTGPEYMPFGYGRHACPGRFFAADELKSMLAHVVVSFDIKLEDGIRPQSLRIGNAISANPRAKVLFRKRAL
ncbi:cytochrome P450 [Melanogaster broomeanus]|nr:cytochrome P450 [Melanogaster broomeanus]